MISLGVTQRLVRLHIPITGQYSSVLRGTGSITEYV